MAFSCVASKQIKLGKRPQVSWLWGTIIIQIFCVPCIFSECLGVDVSLSIYPTGNIYVLYNTPLDILCIAENSSITSEDLQFSLDNKVLSSQIVNSTALRLYIDKPEKQLATYYCQVKKKNGLICPTRVLVESLPPNVTDFSCLSRNLDVLNCTWTMLDIHAIVNFSLTFFINGNEVTECSVKKISDNMWYCIWDAVSSPRYRQQNEYYDFHLKSCNVFGCNHQNITINHFSIIKPDPPTITRIVTGPHHVMLEWDIPYNMYDLLPCNIDHKIEYQIAKIDNITHFRRVNTSILSGVKNRTYKFELTNLPCAYMQYEVRIYIKPKQAGEKYWSDFVYKVFYTTGERPGRPPDMIPGAFDRAIYNNKRVMYVYWKQLEECEEAGANFTYEVTVTQNNESKLVPIDNRDSLSYVILNYASLNAIQVTVRSSNSNGTSLNSSHLYIPPERKTHSLKLNSFTQVANKNGTYELSWDRIENIDNYSLFWCEHQIPKICSGRINFTVLQASTSNFVIDLPADSYRYQFAISANNGTLTSGMVWAICDIAKEGIRLYNFPVNLDHVNLGKSFVMLQWTLLCALKDKIITGYNITYCPIIEQSTLCDDTVGNKSEYIDDPNMLNINITNLLPFKTYRFSIALNTTNGLKTIENTTHFVTTLEDTPSSPRNLLIEEVKYDSIVVSWDPPLHKNGNIREYVVFQFENSSEQSVVYNVSYNMTSKRTVTLMALHPFTNYTVGVKACNIASDVCSELTPTITSSLRTGIGPPSKIEIPPEVKSEPDYIKWGKPKFPGGNLDFYEIRKTVDNGDPEILKTKENIFYIDHCIGNIKSVTYEVRAVNIDNDPYHGVLRYDPNIVVPKDENHFKEYPGDWSEMGIMNCQYSSGLTMVFIIMAIFAVMGTGYGFYKLYIKCRKSENIKPILPAGLDLPEKDIAKYAFITSKDDKPPSDEMLLLPNCKNIVSPPSLKQKDNDNCGVSDHTDSTTLSDSSRAPVERQASSSDDGSNSSLHLETETLNIDKTNIIHEEEISKSDTDSSPNNSPYFRDKSFKKNPTTGYVQPMINSMNSPSSNVPQKPVMQPTTSYVMASLSPPKFTTPIAPPVNQPPLTSGYVRSEDVHKRPAMNCPTLEPSPTKAFGTDCLPKMPALPLPAKQSDNTYIQLQSMDAVPTLKPITFSSTPVKTRSSNGYVRPEDAVITKHMNNMLTVAQLNDDTAIVDPSISPDAYCRFSWSTDPANDNLHSLLKDSHKINTTKN